MEDDRKDSKKDDKKEDKKEEWDISHKVGIKLLSKVQLENVLPTYHNLFRKFDACREAAKREAKTSTRHYQYNFMYDNIFSILGNRGTGKTSVAFTLEKMIRDEYEEKYHDVVLPIIIPEAIPENCSILGWLLAIVKDKIEELEKIAADKRKKENTSSFWDQCRINEKPLQDKLEHMTQLFHAGSYNPSNEASYYKAVDNSVVQAEDYYQFAKSIADLWDAWVKRIQELNQHDMEKGGCPMIYFIFDDVDLAPDRIEQLLSVMIKYLSHPNIIVLTTADEDMFLEVIENLLDRNIGRVPKEWREYLRTNRYSRVLRWEKEEEDDDDDKNELIAKTARMYLGKVLPTSTRYYLRTFQTAKQKELFCLEDNCNLGQGVYKKIGQLLKAVNASEEDDFMMQNNGHLNFYLKYMGNTSRQIGNVYIALQEFIDNMCLIAEEERGEERESLINTIYQNSRYFIRVALNANHELSEFIQKTDKFLDEIFLAEYNQWRIYINYTQLMDFLFEKMENMEKMSNYNKQKIINIGLQLFSLFAFVENILLLMEQGVDSGITNRAKIHTVPFMADYIETIAFEKRHVLRKKLPPNEFFMHYNDLLDRMDIITTSRMSDRKFNMEYFYNFRNDTFENGRIKEKRLEAIYWADRQWFRSLAGMLSMVYGNVYLFDADSIAECVVFMERGQMTECEGYVDREIKENIGNCFWKMKMQDAWAEIKDAWATIWEQYKEAPQNTLGEKDSEEIYNIIITDIIKRMGEQTKEGENEDYYVEVSKVIAECLSYLKGEDDNITSAFPQTGLLFLRKEVLFKLTERIENFGSYDETRMLLLEYQKTIAGFETRIGECGILENKEEVLNQLDRLRDKWRMKQRRKSIYDLAIRLERETEEDCIITKGLYLDLVGELNQIVVEVKETKGFYFEDESEREEIFGLIADLTAKIKLGVRINDREGIAKALEISFEILSFEVLQIIYISQTISQRYENNNLSSKALEKVKTEKGQEDTYYFGVYKSIIKYLETEKKQEKFDMRKDIESAVKGERQRYINRLLAEVENE